MTKFLSKGSLGLLSILFLFLFSMVFPLHAVAEDTKTAKIRADVAAKTETRKLLKKAVDSGESIEGAVTAAIKAGADPVLIVYTANIEEGYSVNGVVAGAIKAGASPDAVVNAAIKAGAAKNAVAKAAVNAGVSPSAVATAVALATSSPAPVFGYTSSAEGTMSTASYMPTPIIIGGKGCGIDCDCTRPATKHKPKPKCNCKHKCKPKG